MAHAALRPQLARDTAACRSLDWVRDGSAWPNRGASRFVRAAGLRWHVQVLGQGPALLLLHGAGAATHSWRTLAPLLAKRFQVVAPDLPGHGFTGPHPRARSLPGMAQALGKLLRALAIAPPLVIGHSAGAAIACRMALDDRIAPAGIAALNGAFLPLRGLAGHLYPRMATLWVRNPLVPWLLAWRARDPARIERLLRSTGSRLDPEGQRLYAQLVRSPQHVAGTLAMMSQWDLRPLLRDLPRLEPPLLLLVGDRDRFVSPAEATEVGALVPHARILHMPELGHLAHEERPGAVASRVVRFARSLGVIP